MEWKGIEDIGREDGKRDFLNRLPEDKVFTISVLSWKKRVLTIIKEPKFFQRFLSSRGDGVVFLARFLFLLSKKQ